MKVYKAITAANRQIKKWNEEFKICAFDSTRECNPSCRAFIPARKYKETYPNAGTFRTFPVSCQRFPIEGD